MKGICLATGLLLSLAAGNASAADVLDSHHWWDSKADEYGIYLSADGLNRYSWTHNILDDGYVPGYSELLWAGLEIRIRDDDYDSYEYGYIFTDQQRLPGDVTHGPYRDAFEFDNGRYAFDLTSLSNLSSDGVIEVTVEMLEGDTILKHSILDIKIPEPARISLTLLSIGLLGLILVRRFRAKS